MTVTLILFADFLGYGGANARKNDKSDDYEDYSDDDQQPVRHIDKGEWAVALFRVVQRISMCFRVYNGKIVFLHENSREKLLDVLDGKVVAGA